MKIDIPDLPITMKMIKISKLSESSDDEEI